MRTYGLTKKSQYTANWVVNKIKKACRNYRQFRTGTPYEDIFNASEPCKRTSRELGKKIIKEHLDTM